MNQIVTTKSMDHEATNSWNGYNYQGKVALYVALDLINRELLDEQSCQAYALELEWREDFSIKKENQYISIHQVKSYKKKELYQYKDALWILLGKSIMGNTPAAFIHTTEPIPEIATIKTELIKLDPPSGSDSKKLYSPLDYYRYIIQNNAYDRAFSRLKKYTYCDGHDNCPLSNITKNIKTQIEQYYDSRNRYRTNEQIERVYRHLLEVVDRHVNLRHITSQNNTANEGIRKLQFELILQVLNQDHEASSEDYYIYHLKELFARCCEENIQQLYQTKGESLELNKLEKFVQVVLSLDDRTFFRLCKKWTPHKRAEKMNMYAFRDLIPNEGLRNPLLRSLYSIKREFLKNNFIYEKRNEANDNLSYLPTTIHENPINLEDEELDEDMVGRLAHSIINNSDIDDLHEVDVMISANIFMESLEIAALKHTKLPSEFRDDHEKITKIKRIRMINFKQAKEELDS